MAVAKKAEALMGFRVGLLAPILMRSPSPASPTRVECSRSMDWVSEASHVSRTAVNTTTGRQLGDDGGIIRIDVARAGAA
jgi:hypothetical protein